MTRANKALALLAVGLLGLWGCTQGPTNGSASVERIRALESKCSKLEDDYRAAAAARDQLRKKLAAVEEERAQLRKNLEAQLVVGRERDDLRQQLLARTQERDALQGQFEQFRKGLRSLLGQADAAAGGGQAVPVSSAGDAPPPGGNS